MIELRCPIHEDFVQPMEDFFCELTRSSWMLFHEGPGKPHWVMGYFENTVEADSSWLFLRKKFRHLPEKYESIVLEDKDWKEAYKEHLKPWNYENLHWVPLWMKSTYPLPAGGAVIWFDAGLAFGTGDHPTTRLCIIRLIDFLKKNPDSKPSVVDAGCGSGILALSAIKLGCTAVAGFDRDPESIRVSELNRAENNISEGAISFYHAGLEEGFRLTGQADIVLANIISDVLCIYADDLVHSIKPGGVLVLSGILAQEQNAVKEFFTQKCLVAWGQCDVEGRTMGDWSDVVLFRI